MLKKYRSYLLPIVSILCLLLLLIPSIRYGISSFFLQTSTMSPRYTVWIDAGHGGFDPGKVGIDGSLEKDVNLAIALKLQKLLIQNDIQVVMTRDTDTALSTESDTNKKKADMRRRREQITACDADLGVSIHQNSFPSEAQKGAQVFYYTHSKESETFAKIMQKQLIKTLDKNNHRLEKSNDSYYLLKETSCPMLIVECGFLSNFEEASKLNSPEYQNQVAWAIHLGILSYLNRYATP